MKPVQIYPLTGIPEVQQQHDLAALIRLALQLGGLDLQDGDVLVVSSKVVSKAEGLRSPAHDGATTDTALGTGTGTGTGTDSGDAQRQGVIAAHSTRVVAERTTGTGRTQIVASAAGPVMAAAGVDDSNTGPSGGSLLLPSDPDLAARSLYAGLLGAYAPAPLPIIGIVISDTSGRPWREGQVDFALGACGVQVLQDLRGSADADGRVMAVTARAVADEIAAAADLVKGKAERVPAALLRGLAAGVARSPSSPGAQSLLRSPGSDWFTLGSAEAVRGALGAPPGTPAAERVGIPAAGPESHQARLDRACALALLAVTTPSGPAARDAVQIDTIAADQGRVGVRVLDPFVRGLIVARLEVALHSEGLEHLTVVPFSGSANESAETSEDLVEAD
ncbi:coenzyme F420-0:L-glutamate ligase [soil metagenome]